MKHYTTENVEEALKKKKKKKKKSILQKTRNISCINPAYSGVCK